MSEQNVVEVNIENNTMLLFLYASLNLAKEILKKHESEMSQAEYDFLVNLKKIDTQVGESLK